MSYMKRKWEDEQEQADLDTERELIPKVQYPLSNHTCGTCSRMLWNCECPQWAKCVECDLYTDDIDGPACPDSLDGVHHWQVPDGDGVRMLA